MNVTAYICGNQLRGIDTGTNPITHTGPSSISEEDGAVEVPLVPVTVDEDDFYVDALIHSIYSGDVRFCRLGNVLSWSLARRETFGVGGSTYETTGINIDYLNPDICDWERTKLSGSFYGLLIEQAPTTGSGSCPEEKEDVINGVGQQEFNTTFLVPGEAIFLYWKFLEGYLQLIRTDYVHSSLLTSGQIIAIHKSSEFSYSITYDLAVEGALVSGVEASDLYDYQVGDWVFVMKVGDNLIFPMRIDGTTGGGVGP